MSGRTSRGGPSLARVARFWKGLPTSPVGSWLAARWPGEARVEPQVRAADERPVYSRVLRLRHINPSDLACFILFEGMIGLAALLALAELVTWWAVPVLPAAVALTVKIDDMIAEALTGGRAHLAGFAAAAEPPRPGVPSNLHQVGRDRDGTIYRVDPLWRRLGDAAHRGIRRAVAGSDRVGRAGR